MSYGGKYLLIFCFLLGYSLTGRGQIYYVENKGQWHENVDFKGSISVGEFFLEEDGFTVLLNDTADIRRRFEVVHGEDKRTKNQSFVFNSFVYKVKFVGAKKPSVVLKEKPALDYENFYIGNDSRRWASDCKKYQSIVYKEIYPGIDLRYYSDLGSIKYEFIVRPGADPSQILMRYDGPTSMGIENKKLVIKTPVSDVTELEPYSYELDGSRRKELKVDYKLTGKHLSFDMPRYDRSNTVVIDPTMVFCSFTGSTTDNWGYTATPGFDGSLYAGGIAFGNGYQVSPGAYDVTFNGGTQDPYEQSAYDIAIFKFNYNGSQRLYATYLGGSNGNEQPHSLIEDKEGNLIVAGRSASSDYPVTTPVKGPGGKYDIILTKFNSNGTSLLGSVRIGGTDDDGVNMATKSGGGGSIGTRQFYGDDARSEVIVDAANNVILASVTKSADFMSQFNSPIQSTFGGLQDGVILKMNPALNNILFVTLFGGTGNDACFVTAVNPANGNIYVGGGTSSPDLPGAFAGAIKPAFQQSTADGFVTIINPAGTAILGTTYLSGNQIGTTDCVDIVYGLKFDKMGFPYVMGTTTGDWPVQNANYVNVGAKQFIAKLKPDLTGYVYSTVFGKSDNMPSISPIAFLVDRCENVYVSGWGGVLNLSMGFNGGTTAGLPEINPLANIPPPDGSDFYFFVLEKNANSCLFASHFGQNGGQTDHVDGGTSRFDENGVIYQGICANCNKGATFPTTAGVIFPSNNSQNCNQAVVKINMNFAGVGSKIYTYDSTKGCAPYKLDFVDLFQTGVTYYWTFNDGTPQQTTTTPAITHTFNNAGNFQVMLIAEDSSKCNIRDTSYINIVVSDRTAAADFSFEKQPPCENLTVKFNNLSVANNASFNGQSFYWDFGDGSPMVEAGMAPVFHTYATAGDYDVKLILKDTIFCNAPDTVLKKLSLNSNVKAAFSVNNLGCIPFAPTFLNNSIAGEQFVWLANGVPFSTSQIPDHIFDTAGTYDIRLVAINQATCNVRDTSEIRTVTVMPGVHANFLWTPIPPEVNTPVSFYNLSVNAQTFNWYFGDGAVSQQFQPVHEYETSGTFTAMLVAVNNAGCSDTAYREIQTLISPALDVPNAFTPGKFGDNSIIKVRGFGIAKLDFKIYNRYGELVFHSTSKEQGWDGTFKGKPQPMEVYAFTVDAEFVTGEKVRKTGDITLIR